MIYGPYKRKGRVQTGKMPQRVKRRSYNARPCRTVFFLRFAVAACVTAILILGGRMLLLEPTALEISALAALTGIALLLLCLMRRTNHRKRN